MCLKLFLLVFWNIAQVVAVRELSIGAIFIAVLIVVSFILFIRLVPILFIFVVAIILDTQFEFNL